MRRGKSESAVATGRATSLTLSQIFINLGRLLCANNGCENKHRSVFGFQNTELRKCKGSQCKHKDITEYIYVWVSWNVFSCIPCCYSPLGTPA